VKENNHMKAGILIFLLGLTVIACGPQNPGSVAGPGSAVINSNSLIAGEIKAIRQQPSGPWEIDVLIVNIADIDSLPNPVKDRVGQLITAKTDEDMDAFKAGQKITANFKYVGDVPRPGITLYIFNIKIDE
jgi:hypothetical protein